MTHLWEIEHPYYAREGNYFSNDCHAEYGSWADFFGEEGDADKDYNLLYRWDWKLADEDEPEDFPEHLALYYIGQRKALARSVRVRISRDDEPAVREFLAGYAAHLRSVWEPVFA